jgi:hypothetical protein
VVWQGNKYNYRQVRWDEEQLARANLAANKMGGAWDFDILANEFEEEVLLAGGFEGWEIGLGEGEPNQNEDKPIDIAEARATLAERFVVPPFSVLDARQGYWQDRKRAWLALGIQSELGRGDTPSTSARSDTPTYRTIRGRTLGAIAPNEAGDNGILTSPGKYAPKSRGGVKMALRNDPMQRKDKYDGKR